MEETSNAGSKRKVGRPKKMIEIADFDKGISSFDAEIEEIDAEMIVSKPPNKKQRNRDLPNKTQWINIIGNSIDVIPNQRLPTNRVIMQRYNLLRTQSNNRTSIYSFSESLYNEIIPIWIKANIPTVDKKTCVKRISALLESWGKQECRKMVVGSEKEILYSKMLDSLCSLTHQDIETVKFELKQQRLLQHTSELEGRKLWEADYEFFLGQMKNPQVGTIAGKDLALERRKSSKIQRECATMIRGEKAQVSDLNVAASVVELSSVIGTSSSSSSDDDLVTSDEEYIPDKILKKPKKLDSVMLKLPTKDLLKDSASICARLKLSNTAIVSLYAKIIVSGGGELKDFVMSKTSAWRQRIKGEKETEKKMKIEFKELSLKNPYGILHWDGKQVKYASGEVEERLAICLQQVGSEKQPTFLGAPQTPDGKGVSQVEAIVRYIDDSGTEDQIIGHVWDTTASNTGCNFGAAMVLDKALGRANLWLGCRRHASERHVVHANKAVVGPTTGPDEALFKRFKDNFDLLDINDLKTYSWDGDEVSSYGPYLFSTERALMVKEWAEDCCKTGVFPREDYRELLELITFVLNGEIFRKSNINDTELRKIDFKMERPGAFHHARFMAKAIYYIKMFVLLPQLLDKSIFTYAEGNQIERMATFIILVYGQYFLQSALTAAAPRLDLSFWKNAVKYKVIDADISDAVIKSVHRQMFYLVEETVVFALCDDGTSNEEKDSIIKALLECNRPQTFPPMKPCFKNDLLINKPHDMPQLKDFVGPRSWLIFHLFDVDVEWMEYSSSNWINYPEYIRFRKLVKGIVCVNDVAERNVKNIVDYAEYSKDSERRDTVIKVVNYHREFHDFSNLTKAELQNL